MASYENLTNAVGSIFESISIDEIAKSSDEIKIECPPDFGAVSSTSHKLSDIAHPDSHRIRRSLFFALLAQQADIWGSRFLYPNVFLLDSTKTSIGDRSGSFIRDYGRIIFFHDDHLCALDLFNDYVDYSMPNSLLRIFGAGVLSPQEKQAYADEAIKICKHLNGGRALETPNPIQIKQEKLWDTGADSATLYATDLVTYAPILWTKDTIDRTDTTFDLFNKGGRETTTTILAKSIAQLRAPFVIPRHHHTQEKRIAPTGVLSPKRLAEALLIDKTSITASGLSLPITAHTFDDEEDDCCSQFDSDMSQLTSDLEVFMGFGTAPISTEVC